MRGRDRRKQKGNTFIEFVLVTAFFFVPLILGLTSVGIAVIRALQVNQLTRDVGHMQARGVDFSQQQNQDMVTNRLAGGLSIPSNSGNVTGGTTGNGVVVLSAFNHLPGSCGCSNGGHSVLVRRIVIGNNTLFASAFGAPAYIDASSGLVANYSTDGGARADTLSNVISLNDGELAYMVEAKFAFKDLGYPGFLANLGSFSRSVF